MTFRTHYRILILKSWSVSFPTSPFQCKIAFLWLFIREGKKRIPSYVLHRVVNTYKEEIWGMFSFSSSKILVEYCSNKLWLFSSPLSLWDASRCEAVLSKSQTRYSQNKIALFLWLPPAWPSSQVLRTPPPLRLRSLCSLHHIVMLSVTSSLFQSFFEGQSAPWDSAKKDENRMKNRYGNIIACKRWWCVHLAGLHQAQAVRIYCAITAFLSAAWASFKACPRRRGKKSSVTPATSVHPPWGPIFTFRFKV